MMRMMRLGTRILATALPVGIAFVAIAAVPAGADTAQVFRNSIRQAVNPYTGFVWITYPDGSQDIVTSTTAEALNRSLNGADAYGAYAGLGLAVPGSWVSETRKIVTGDICRWTGYSGVAAVYGGSVRIVFQGHFENFNPQAHGAFLGFFHPH